MNTQKVSLLQALGLPQDLADEDCTHSIFKLISLTAREESHSVSLKNIYDAIFQYKSAEYLVIRPLASLRTRLMSLEEPLDVLPVLLPCRHDGAMDLIRLCAQNGSAKEVMIVVQEEIERLQTRLDHDEDEDEGIDSDLAQKASGIVLLCSPAISQSKLGKGSALELCSPILKDLTTLIPSVSLLATKEQGRMLITQVATLVKNLNSWASEVTNASGLRAIRGILRELLDTTVVSCAPSIQASLAVRAAQTYFGRLFPASVEERGLQDGNGPMLIVELALESLGDTPRMIPWKPSSFSDLVYLAHSTSPLPVSPPSQPDLHHLLISALQLNIVVDEALFLLFQILADKNTSISPEVLVSLCTVFAALTSTHLDATIRQLNFRLLSLTLSRLPSPLRLEILLNLTTHEDFPQIRGPAVGLVKEAVLEALALPADHGSPFASPELLRIFGGVLFRPNPPGFFSERRTREELGQSLELLRIADCLSFYYVLLQRDRENKTGVRSKGNVTSVQSSILRPLRRFLDEHIGGEEQPLMAMLSLQVGLDRIDDALRALDSDKDE